MRTGPALRLAGVALFASLCGACVHVGHGPRVEPGTNGFVSLAVSRNTDVDGESRTLVPDVQAGFTHGWVFENGVATSFGLQIPPLWLPFVFWGDEVFEDFARLVMADVYIQPRRGPPGSFDYGAGALVSTGVAVPYIQLGRDKDGGVFTTQAVMIPYDRRNRVLYWMPSISLRSMRPDGSRTVDYYIGGIYGRAEYDFPQRTETEWALSVGVVLGFRRSR